VVPVVRIKSVALGLRKPGQVELTAYGVYHSGIVAPH